MYIDTHSHIYLENFSDDKNAMLQRASLAGVKTILMPAIDAATHEAMLALEASKEVSCFSMMGLHPCSVNENLQEELKIAEKYLGERKFAAIGETGLDFYWDLTHKEAQYRSFKQQIEWALDLDLPIVIHSRESTDACIDVIEQYSPRALRGVFHCFGGTVEQAERIIANGFFLGIGGVLTFKKAGLDKVLEKVPLDNIILETDAPYLAPVPYRGKRNEPSYLPFVAQKLSEVKEMAIDDVASITTRNAKNLFRL